MEAEYLNQHPSRIQILVSLLLLQHKLHDVIFDYFKRKVLQRNFFQAPETYNSREKK